MQHDGAGFEQNEAVILEDWHLSEGLQRTIFRLVLIALFQEARFVRHNRDRWSLAHGLFVLYRTAR
jgi:hypothetical protein